MNKLLLDVWQEVGRHTELSGAVEAIARILAQSAPLNAIEILRFNPERLALETAAASYRDGQRPLHGPRIGLTGDGLGSLLDWFSREEVTAIPAKGPWPDMLAPLAEAYLTQDVLIGALRGGGAGQPEGIVVLLAGAGTLKARHAQVLHGMLEPLAVALENDGRLRELSELRASAEAERQSLLTQLGRDKPSEAIVGKDGGLRPVLIRVDQVARSDSSVLLLGETGSGKEVIARAIHDRSLRAQAPFIRVNCGALPPELIDSELFGHEKGSFTGAAARRKGWFEQANGGTLFLDEVGELPPAVQVRLLRVLQDGSMYRVGSEEAIHVDVRVIAATHRDLAAMVQEGTFREDLWYRIAVFPILIPPVRERPQDIPELARHFARRASAKIGLHLQLPSEEDIALLRAYAWPGNVREMAAVIERAVILGEGRRLEVAAALGLSAPARPGPARAAAEKREGFATLDQAIVDHIRAALAHTRGRIEGRKGAARLLAVNPHTLRSRMRKLGIDPRPFREDAEEEE